MVIDKLRRHFLRSARVALNGVPVVFRFPSDISEGWGGIRCHGCKQAMTSGSTIYLGEINPLSKFEPWVYICLACCSTQEVDKLVASIDAIIDLELTGVNALIMIWGSFDNIPADMLL